MQKYNKNEKSIIMITVFYTLKSDIQASDIESRKKIYNIQLKYNEFPKNIVIFAVHIKIKSL